MCIRDRLQIDVGDEVELRIIDRGVGAITLNNINLAMASNAVSYTHLRAHETVLDLVCRLLLEKKKQTIQQANHLLQYVHTT